MTEEQIRKQIKNGTVDWHWISYKQVLSEEFIREFQDKIRWDLISRYQVLSENFIREFQNKVDWYYISYNNKIPLSTKLLFYKEYKLNNLNPEIENTIKGMKKYFKWKRTTREKIESYVMMETLTK